MRDDNALTLVLYDLAEVYNKSYIPDKLVPVISAQAELIQTPGSLAM